MARFRIWLTRSCGLCAALVAWAAPIDVSGGIAAAQDEDEEAIAERLRDDQPRALEDLSAEERELYEDRQAAAARRERERQQLADEPGAHVGTRRLEELSQAERAEWEARQQAVGAYREAVERERAFEEPQEQRQRPDDRAACERFALVQWAQQHRYVAITKTCILTDAKGVERAVEMARSDAHGAVDELKEASERWAE